MFSSQDVGRWLCGAELGLRMEIKPARNPDETSDNLWDTEAQERAVGTAAPTDFSPDAAQ